MMNCWQGLDEGIIYSKLTHLRLRDIQINRNIEFFNIVPIGLVILNKSKLFLSISIETAKYSIICQLEKLSLNLKIKYKIFQKSTYEQGPIQETSKNFLLQVQIQNVIQLRRNKLIRKYKGSPIDLINSEKIAFRAVPSNDIFRFENYFVKTFEHLFQNKFTFSMKQFYQLNGNHRFKKIGDFIILKNSEKLNKPQSLLLYYVQVETGQYGRILLFKNERLKMIKAIDNNLYIVLKQNHTFELFKIKGESDRLILYSIQTISLKKPIIQLNYLIFTNILNKKIFPVQYLIKQIDQETKQE